MLRLGHPSRRCEQVPLAGDTFQDMVTAAGEADPGSGDQILHRARYEHLARARQVADPRSDVDGDPREPIAPNLHLPGV